MIDFVTIYQCDVCEKSSQTNGKIMHVVLSKPEMHEEGCLETEPMEFDICNECAMCYTINQLIEFFNDKEHYKNRH